MRRRPVDAHDEDVVVRRGGHPCFAGPPGQTRSVRVHQQMHGDFKMSKRLALLAAAAALALVSGTAVTTLTAQEKTVQVGGAPMYPSKNIIQNAVNSKDHTTLVAAVKAAGLVDTLSGPGPFTVFAPTNA